MRALVPFFLAALCGSINAQLPEPPPLEQVLVPVFPERQAGRFGSLWDSELIVTNPTGQNVLFSSSGPYCMVTGCSDIFVRIPHGTSIFPGGIDTGGPVGTLWIVESEYADQLSFFLRLWDRSRENDDWGTSIPVVREDEFLSEPKELVGAPTGPEFRVTLRVYEPSPTNSESVLVTIYPLEDTGASPIPAVATITLPLRGGTPPEVEPRWPTSPAVGQLDDIVANFPQLMTHDRFGVRVEPLSSSFRYWAMLSVTHNQTQHVTIIAPE